MRRRWTSKLALPLFVTLLAACDDATGPGPDPVDFVDLALDFCGATGQFPVFFAYRNTGEGWTRVTGDANRTFAFRASDKVAVAMVFTDGAGTYFTDVIYAKNEELQPLSGTACAEAIGSKSVNGSVVGVAAGDYSYVSMGLSTELIEPPPSTYTLFDLANSPLDLVAHSGSAQIEGDVPDAFIIRRGQNPPNGSTLAALDFNSGEAAAPAVNTATITGLSASDDNLIDLYFSTATTFDQPIFLSDFFTSAAQTIFHVPSTLTQAGDLHMLDAYGTTTNGLAVRGETQWYRIASNRTVSLGSHLSTPTVSSIATTPVVRMRAQLPVQPEYNSFAVALYEQIGTTIVRSVSVLGTAAHFDSPSTWTLDIPDLSGLPGFPTESGLGGTSLDYQIFAYGGNLATFFGAPEEGSTMKYAARASSTTPMIALRAEQRAEKLGRRAPGLQLSKRRLGIR